MPSSGTAQVEHFRQNHIQTAEVGYYLSKIKPPARGCLHALQNLGMTKLGNGLYKSGTGHKHLARRTGITSKGHPGHFYQRVLRKQLPFIFELLSGLRPYALR